MEICIHVYSVFWRQTLTHTSYGRIYCVSLDIHMAKLCIHTVTSCHISDDNTPVISVKTPLPVFLSFRHSPSYFDPVWCINVCVCVCVQVLCVCYVYVWRVHMFSFVVYTCTFCTCVYLCSSTISEYHNPSAVSHVSIPSTNVFAFVHPRHHSLSAPINRSRYEKIINKKTCCQVKYSLTVTHTHK